MNKLLVVFSITMLAMMWPFSCTPQSGPCDPIIVEDPEMRAEIERLKGEITGLTDENAALMVQLNTLTAENVALREDMDALNAQISSLQGTVASQQAEISNLRETNNNLSAQLEECLNKPADTVEVIVEVPVMPEPTIDTIYVTHSNDEKTNRRYFHHGTLEEIYPKQITFETKEFCMITVMFNDTLTKEVREADSIKVKRIRDHENAVTSFEFIKE